jgi:HEAT repeat protein
VPAESAAPADAAVRRRLVDAVNVSYRLAAESRPAPAKVLGEFAPASVASTNALRLPRGEDVRAYEEGRPWARRHQPAVVRHTSRGAEAGVPAWPRREHAADLRRLLGDPDPDVRCMAAEALATLRRPEDVEPLRRLLRDEALGPPMLAWNMVVTARLLPDADVEVEGLRADRSWQDYSVARTAWLALSLVTGESLSDLRRGWLRQLSHAERAKRREAVDILAAVDDRTGETFVALAEALANEIRTANPGTGQVGGEFAELEARLASLLVRFGTKADITTLARPLQEDNPRLRLTFAGILRLLGAHALPAASRLVALLGDRDLMVRMTAADALWRIGDRGAVPALVKATGDEEVAVRYRAAQALREAGDRRAILALAQRMALTNEDWIVREAAAQALGKIGTAESLAALVRAVERDIHPSVRKAAIAGIANIGGPPAAAALEGFVGTRPTLFGNKPIEALGSMVSPEGDAALVRLLKSGDGVVRFHAARALGRKGNAGAIEALFVVLATDKEAWIRKEAAESLGRIGERAAIPSLKKALEDKEWDVRCVAAGVLGELGDSAGLALTVAEAGHEDYVRRRRAMQALGRIGGPAALAALRAGLKDADDSVRSDAARELGRLGDSESAGVLTAMLRDESREVRHCAAGALTVLGHAECLPALRKTAEDTDLALREVAMDAIRRVEAREILESLVASVEKTDATLAAELSDPARTSPAAPVIRNLGKHRDPRIRESMVNFMGKVGGMDDIAFLEKMRRDPDPAVREAAASAINEIRDRQPRPSPIEPCIERGDTGELSR